jgi:hypothetical protein
MDRLPIKLADALGPPFAAAVKLGVEDDAALAFEMIFAAAASGRGRVSHCGHCPGTPRTFRRLQRHDERVSAAIDR